MAPLFIRVVLFAQGVRNFACSDELSGMLESVAAMQASRPGTTAEEYLASWDQAHRLFGSNPNKYPPSIRALYKRAVQGKEIPFINSVVAIMNIVSLHNLVPCGGDDLASVNGDLVLGIATGAESFRPLGRPELFERPDPGEVIYFDSANSNVMCRRWNWRNGDMTKLGSDTTDLVVNIDGLPPVSPESLVNIGIQLSDLLRSHCGAKVQMAMLHRTCSEWALDRTGSSGHAPLVAA